MVVVLHRNLLPAVFCTHVVTYAHLDVSLFYRLQRLGVRFFIPKIEIHIPTEAVGRLLLASRHSLSFQQQWRYSFSGKTSIKLFDTLIHASIALLYSVHDHGPFQQQRLRRTTIGRQQQDAVIRSEERRV